MVHAMALMDLNFVSSSYSKVKSESTSRKEIGFLTLYIALCYRSQSLLWKPHGLWTFTDHCWFIHWSEVWCVKALEKSLQNLLVFFYWHKPKAHGLMQVHRPERWICVKIWLTHLWLCDKEHAKLKQIKLLGFSLTHTHRHQCSLSSDQSNVSGFSDERQPHECTGPWCNDTCSTVEVGDGFGRAPFIRCWAFTAFSSCSQRRLLLESENSFSPCHIHPFPRK